MYGPILKGKKVVLQPPKLSEAKNFVSWFEDDEVIRYISSSAEGLTLEKEKLYLKNLKDKADTVFWSAYTKSGKHIGSTDLHGFSPNHKRTSWGIVIGEKTEWSKGYGADILRTVMKYVFETLRLNRFELEVFHKNTAGIKCYTKCGFIKEGVRRKYFVKNGEVYDSILMSLTNEDYKELKKKKKI